MNHADAVRKEAVERYLLGELSGPERDEFESHFFDCGQCASDLQMGALFEENARTVFHDDAARGAIESKRAANGWRSFWETLRTNPLAAVPAFAAVVMVLLGGYQNLVTIPGLRGQLGKTLSPQAVASFVLPPLSRGEAPVREVDSRALFYTVYMDPTWEGSFAAYLCSVQDESGVSRFNVRLPAPPPGKPVQVLVSRALLPSGRYTVIIRNAGEPGKPEAELARYALNLKID